MNTETLAALQQQLPTAKPRIALVLGSGWAGAEQHLQDPVRVPYAALPGFPPSQVEGHSSELVWGRLGAHEVVVLTGRKHTYETDQPTGMKLPLRALREWGVELLVQTNAAGSLRAGMGPGSLMLITDHINLPQRSPLVGEPGSERFVSMVNAYDRHLREQAQIVAKAHGETLHHGVYAWCLGPQFETPAEIRMLGLLGADAVGMSTVPETIIARHAGMRVLALSLVTNMAAGLSDETLSHANTMSQAAAASERAARLLAGIVGHLKL